MKELQEGKYVSFGRIDEDAEADNTSGNSQEKRRALGLLVGDIIARACGILPWSTTRQRCARSYQLAITGLSAVIMIKFAVEVYDSYKGSSRGWRPWAGYAGFLPSCLDATNSLGVLLGLVVCGSLRSSPALTSSSQVLDNYIVRNKLHFSWGAFARRDLVVSFLTFVTIIVFRIAVASPEEDEWSMIAFGCMSFLNMGLVGYILCTCRGLVAIVDAFCHNMIESPHFGLAVREWGLVQAVCRSVSASLQSCFVVLLTMATVTVLVVLTEISNSHTFSPPLIPRLLLAAATFRISLWAAEVTDKCQRVPLLVNSLSVGTELDVNRMYTVDYIVHAKAGFYVFETRLTCSSLMKAVYIACAVTVGIVTQLDERKE